MKKSLMMIFNLICLILSVAKKMTDSDVSALKKIAEIPNANLIKNADALLTKRPVDSEIEWVNQNWSCIPENKFKVSY